jgi:hypothetical protein
VVTVETFRKSVGLSVPADQFLREQFHFEGVNYELNPIVHMTAPSEWKSRPLTEAPVKQKFFTSVLLLFGFLPIDLHHILFDQILENGFRETSHSLSMKHWNHNREVESLEQGCVVTDELSYATRIPFLGAVLKPVYLFVFNHRHARLRKKYGGTPEARS